MAAKAQAVWEPISADVQAARGELRAVARDLAGALARVRAIAGGLRQAAAAAPAVGTLPDGHPETEEAWLAGSLEDCCAPELEELVAFVRAQARKDWRPEIRRSLAEAWQAARRDQRIRELADVLRAGGRGAAFRRARAEFCELTGHLKGSAPIVKGHREELGLTARELRELRGEPAPCVLVPVDVDDVPFPCYQRRYLSAEEEEAGCAQKTA